MSGVFLETKYVIRAHALHNILRNMSGNPDFNISKCPMCKGTGLLGVSGFGNNGDKQWDGRFCELCKGVGFEQTCYKDILFVCKRCDGTGHGSYEERECSQCNGRGIVDWVTRARGI